MKILTAEEWHLAKSDIKNPSKIQKIKIRLSDCHKLMDDYARYCIKELKDTGGNTKFA